MVSPSVRRLVRNIAPLGGVLVLGITGKEDSPLTQRQRPVLAASLLSDVYFKLQLNIERTSTELAGKVSPFDCLTKGVCEIF